MRTSSVHVLMLFLLFRVLFLYFVYQNVVIKHDRIYIKFTVEIVHKMSLKGKTHTHSKRKENSFSLKVNHDDEFFMHALKKRIIKRKNAYKFIG